MTPAMYWTRDPNTRRMRPLNLTVKCQVPSLSINNSVNVKNASTNTLATYLKLAAGERGGGCKHSKYEMV